MSFESVNEARKRTLALRKSLSREQIVSLSHEVTTRFLHVFDIVGITRARRLHVGMYRALPFELDVGSVGSYFKMSGCNLHFPRVVQNESKELEFVDMTHLFDSPSAWKVGSYGIYEPSSELSITPPEKLDLIFVPGVMFGESGERVGMGAGYYDRFLPKNPKALRVVLTFDFQVFPVLEQKTTDQPVHWIITEKREVRTPFVHSWWKQWETA